ncbi:MAG TPA: thioesterase family protein [Gammaproteobacteria bacterium]|nr:thioesterase family protein [Gammaproteobacteria bacterium]
MGRIQIDLPERFTFSTELEVRVSDLNYGNHLGNDGVLTLLHEARRRYLRSLGEDEIGKDGLGFVVADAELVYRAQAFYGERLRIELAAGEFQSRSCSFFYRAGKPGGETVAEARTGVVCFDFKAQKAVSFPPALLAKLQGRPGV